jgi:hypothetical protein
MRYLKSRERTVVTGTGRVLIQCVLFSNLLLLWLHSKLTLCIMRSFQRDIYFPFFFFFVQVFLFCTRECFNDLMAHKNSGEERKIELCLRSRHIAPHASAWICPKYLPHIPLCMPYNQDELCLEAMTLWNGNMVLHWVIVPSSMFHPVSEKTAKLDEVK